jgi:hypothetical protein
MTWLIISRAVQGLGGGGKRAYSILAHFIHCYLFLGIFQMVNIIVGDVVSLEE